jgi:uncharacterized membrane protein YfcA
MLRCMLEDLFTTPWLPMALALVFALAGFVKGMVGLGLPTIAMALLSLRLAPAEAAALLIVPSLVTNVWQLFNGPALRSLCRRLWPLQLGVVTGTWVGAALLGTPGGSVGSRVLLGLCLLAYAGLGLSGLALPAPRPAHERLASITAGALTGLLAAATGVFVLPAVPYLQSLRLGRDELVQALGLTFTISTLALAGQLMAGRAFTAGMLPASALALSAALMGMALGQWAREGLSPLAFRRWFLAGLGALGGYLALAGAR